MTSSGYMRKRIAEAGWLFLLALVIGIGLAVRVAMAWAMRYSANGDFGIVALMAKHMAEGTDYPVFCYGVAYMGGLEPLASALMSFLMRGDSTAFPVNLGTALVGAFLLPLVYVLGRDAGNRRAGLIALLYCVVGSDTLLHYSVAPRGGYMAMMVGGLATLWLMCRVVTLENYGGRASRRAFWLMGLAAGLAWWATQLVTVFIVVAILIALAGWRKGLLRGLVPGAAGFFLASSPWWWWNATHQWVSLDFGSSLGKVTFQEGLRSFGTLFLVVVEIAPDTVTGWARLALLTGLAAGFVWILVGDKIRGRDKRMFYYRLAVPFLLIVMALFYSTSQYVRANASRYLLPVVPPLAVMIGVTCDRLLSRFRFPWGWILAGAVLPSQILVMTHMFDGVETDRASWGLASRLEARVSPLCQGVFLGDYYHFHWLNFASREKLSVATLPLERYAPYARRAELADHPAFLDNYNGILSFLASTRGDSRRVIVEGIPVNYALTPPPDDWAYVDSNTVMAIRDGSGGDCREVLQDSAMDSIWRTVVPPRSTRSLEFSFASPLAFTGIRLLSPDDRYPGMVSIEGRAENTVPWQSLMPPMLATRYFWSGSHALLDGIQFYQEFRVGAPAGGIRGLRVTFHNPADREVPLRMGEVLLLQQSPHPGGRPPSVTGCVETLRDRGVRRVFAPRWLATRMAVAAPGEWVVRVPSLVPRGIHELAVSDSTSPLPLTFPETTGLIMDERDVPRSRAALSQAGLRWTETPLGSLRLLVVAGGATFPADVQVYWTEQGCFAARESKAKAQLLYERVIRKGGQAGPGPSDQEVLREALRWYPAHYPARMALVSALKAGGQEAEAGFHSALLKATAQPEIPADIQFGNGARLVGITLGAKVVKPGQAVPVTYFWKCPSRVDPGQWAVFVHFKRERVLFQDDHVFLEDLPLDRLQRQPFDEIFTESRQMTIPGSVPPGEVRVFLGMLDRRANQRVSVKTGLNSRKRTVELPVILEVR